MLRWLAHVTGETSILAVLRDARVLYLDVVAGSSPLRVCVEAGARAPAHASASGEARLAHRPEELPGVLRARRKRITPVTVTRLAQLRRRLAEMRRSGLSLCRGERRPDIASVAAPVFDGRAQCVAAVSLAGPATRFRDETLEEVERHVRKAS
ncbi:MAG TPA: IclR family transcriptional regulator C-terminal domain-containing protein, partial [Methylomirabilota bacterium]|nr:IclR family transcriptional regulator C-terminal domain-containing protein [Methylomirabilota bacterium]